MTRDAALTILLIEDNPGDARYIRELLQDGRELLSRAGSRESSEVSEGTVSEGEGEGELELLHESRLAAGVARLEERRPAVVLLDLNLPDSVGLETLTAVLDATNGIPVVVLTGLADRETGIEAIRSGADEYLVKDEINADLLIRSISHTIERNAYERRLEQQREQLAALNQLNQVVQEITGAVLQQSTREEIERLVCERLANTDSYLFAWIGDLDRTRKTVVVRTEAGITDYLDGTEITYDDSETSAGPTGRAVRTKEMQVTRHVLEDPDYEPWHDHVERFGFRSSAAIPIVYEGSFYGVLNVYSARSDAFGGQEGAVIGQLGEVVGHAIASIERKEALTSESVIELGFEIQNFLESAGVSNPAEGTITMDRTVAASDDNYLVYGTADDDGVELLHALVEGLSHWDSVRVLSTDGGMTRFEARLSEPPIVSLIASQSGRVRSATIEDGDYRITAQVPPSVDVRHLVERVHESFPDAAVISQRHTSRTTDSNTTLSGAAFDTLTERQRTVLEVAFRAGFFDWPRARTGEEVAASLDISPATFHQHLRTSERKIFGTLLDEE